MSLSASQYIIGVDLGGTKISVGAMPTDGSREIAMRADLTLASEGGADGVVGRIAFNIEAVIAQLASFSRVVRMPTACSTRSLSG
jgi:predicted NBD/HSP70 family sugar kinase